MIDVEQCFKEGRLGFLGSSGVIRKELGLTKYECLEECKKEENCVAIQINLSIDGCVLRSDTGNLKDMPGFLYVTDEECLK